MKTAIELHREKLKEIGYKDAAIEELTSRYRDNFTYDFAEEYAKERVNSALEEAVEKINVLEPYNPKHLEPQENLSQLDAEIIISEWYRFQSVKKSILSLKIKPQ